MPLNSKIRCVQITLRIRPNPGSEDYAEMEISADVEPDAISSGQGQFHQSGFDGEGKVVFQEVVDKVRSAYPSHGPLALNINSEHVIIATNVQPT